MDNIKLTPEEVRDMSIIAAKIHNKYATTKTPEERQAFILGFLHGRQFTLDDIGILDSDNNDDDRIYAFLKDRN